MKVKCESTNGKLVIDNYRFFKFSTEKLNNAT